MLRYKFRWEAWRCSNLKMSMKARLDLIVVRLGQVRMHRVKLGRFWRLAAISLFDSFEVQTEQVYLHCHCHHFCRYICRVLLCFANSLAPFLISSSSHPYHLNLSTFYSLLRSHHIAYRIFRSATSSFPNDLEFTASHSPSSSDSHVQYGREAKWRSSSLLRVQYRLRENKGFCSTLHVSHGKQDSHVEGICG